MTNIEKYLRVLVLACLFAIPALVLYVPDWSFFPYIVGKNMLFRLLTEVSFFAWVALVLFGSLPKLKVTSIHIAIGVFITTVAVADFTGVAPFKSFWSNFERMDGLITLLHGFAFFIVASSVLNSRKLWSRFWLLSLSISFIVGVLAVAELASGVSRISGTTGNPIYLAVYALFHIFIALIYAYKSNNYLLKWMYSIFAVFNIIVLWLSGTRGALIGLLIGGVMSLIYIIFCSRGIEHKTTRIISGLVVSVIFVLIIIFPFVKDNALVQNNSMLSRLSNITLSSNGEQSTSSARRVIIWDMAISGVKERPLLGWGQENFNYVFNKYYNPKMYNAEQWYDRTHNIMLDWLIAAGVLGLLAYLSLYAVISYEVVKAKSFNIVESALLIGLLFAYFVHNLFVFDHLVSYILFFSLAAWVNFVSSIKGDIQKSVESPAVSNFSRSLILVTLTVTVIIFVYLINYPAYMQNRLIIKALILTSNPATLDDSIDSFMEASNYNAIGTQEAREQFLLTAARLAQFKHVDTKVKEKFLIHAIKEMQKQQDRYPLDARFPHLIASSLSTHGLHEAAVPYLERALELSPTKVNFLMALGSNAVMRGENTTALDFYKRALKLESSNSKAERAIKAITTQ
ncbi:MAG: O-antigen ligase family protein [Candidatus Pacebacteria bacterium]|nr:O-antigen ligase family protein [Candidatus Paceibacterota bacterium]